MTTEMDSDAHKFRCDLGDNSPDVRQEGPEVHDIAILTVNGDKCVSVVCSPPDRVGEEPRQREIRIWTFDESKRLVRQLEPRAIELPFPKEVALSNHGKRIIAAGTSNFEWPGFVGRWTEAPGWAGVYGTPEAIPVALTSEQAASVAVPLRWSTVGLSSQEWLYGPRIHPAPVTAGVFVSIETTDGKTVFWRYNAQGGTITPVGMLPGAVDPVVFEQTDGMRVLYRVPDPHWSGFHDSPLYSFARGPVALPLALVELEPGGVKRKQWTVHLPPSFAFDAVADPAGGFVIATAGDSREMPRLFVYSTTALDKPCKIREVLALQNPPIEVRVLATEKGIVLALLYQISGTRLVECYYRIRSA